MRQQMSYTCVVPVTITHSSDVPSKAMPFTSSALKALAHIMVYEAMKHTEEARGFYAEGAGDAVHELHTLWVMPKGFDSMEAMERRIVKGRRICTTTKPAG